MRLAVISDIHGNFEAFQQVLADIDRSGIDAIISLGDNVGYGPEPDLVVQKIRARRIPSVQGNHELALKDPEYLNWFNPSARESLVKTRGLLSDESLRFISKLKPSLVSYDCRFVHGFPPDSPLIYVFQTSDRSKIEAFKKSAERLCFIGHTHSLEIIGYDGQKLEYHDLPQGITNLDRKKKFIINIGSVGQPRDATSDAKYAIWDSASDTIDIRFVTYDIASVVKKIRDAGLPEEHARRLW
jgi:predicted phosphodiesterase